jgi:hypothetical protein
MICPKCNIEMIRGASKIDGTLATALLVGVSYQKLWFRKRSNYSDRGKSLMKPQRDYPAWYCRKCNVLTVENVDKA